MKKFDLIEISIKSERTQQLIYSTDQINEYIEKTEIENGIGVIFSPHSTSGLTINSYIDEKTAMDLNDELNRLIPTRLDFHHVVDTPTDASGHIKSSIIGSSFSVIIKNGKLLLGSNQGMFFWEFDGPRERKVYIKIIGDNKED